MKEPEEDFKHWDEMMGDDDPYAKPDICGWEDK